MTIIGDSMVDNKHLCNLSKIENNIRNNNIYLDSFPAQIHFLMIDKCNAKCIMCGGDYFKSTSGRRITLEKFKTMASNLQLEYTHGIVLAGAGDPLLNEDLIPIVRFVREEYPHIRISITTNGIALTKKLCESLLESNVDIVNVSINSATRETYQRIMQVDCFDKVCKNTKRLIDMRNQLGKTTQVQFSSAINRLNIEDLPTLVELGRQAGIDSINIMYCRFYPERIRYLNVDREESRLKDMESLYYHQELSDQIVERAKSLAKQSGIHFSHEPLFKENIASKSCIWPKTEMMVGFDGEIYPCGGAELHFKKKVDGGIYNFGNAMIDPIERFWNGETYRALRISSQNKDKGIIPECECCANNISPNDLMSHIMQWDGPECKKGDNNRIEENKLVIVDGTGASPLVSVIVPTYNRSDMVVAAIKSILDQTYHNFEIIVVNDAGEDIEHIITSLNLLSNITYVKHAENRGLAATRNTGIKVARGAYISLLDDDDLFYPDHLETAIRYLNDKNPVIYTDAVRATFTKSEDTYKLIGKKVPYSMDFNRNKLLIGNIAPVNCFVFDRNLALKAGLFDETLSTLEDWEFWIRLSAIVPFKHIAKETVQVNWRTDGTTMTSLRGPEFRQNRERICKKYENEIKRIQNTQEIMDEFNAIWANDWQGQPQLTSIIILTHNQIEYTKKCIDSIFEHTKEPFELIVVDNGSTDGTVEYLESEVRSQHPEPRIEIIKNKENLGFAAGNNQGIAEAKGDYILLMNNDIVVTSGWLTRMIVCAERKPQIGIVGPVSNYVSGPQLVKEVNYDTSSLTGLTEFAREFSEQYTGQAKPFWRVVGFCMLIKRAVIEKIGGMDGRFGLGNFEDDDFNLRSTLAGFESWIADDCYVHHFGSRTFIGARIDYGESLNRNWEKFKKKWGIPKYVSYGASYDMASVLKDGFMPMKHYCPLNQNEDSEIDSITPLTSEDKLLMGEALFHESRFHEAEDIFREILKGCPDHSKARNNLACLLWQTGRAEKSLEEISRAMEIAPDDRDIVWNCGQFLKELGFLEDATEVYRDFLQRHPDDVEISETLENMEKMPRENGTAPCEVQELIEEGECLFEKGKVEDARRIFKKIVSMDPKLVEPLNNLGVIAFQQGEIDKAVFYFNSALEIEADYFEAIENLGKCMVAKEDYPEAIRWFERTLESKPDNIDVLNSLGNCFIQTEDFVNAKTVYAKSIQLDSSQRNVEMILQKLERLSEVSEQKQTERKARVHSGQGSVVSQ